MNNAKAVKMVVIAAVALVVVAIAFIGCMYTVDEGYVAAVYTLGKLDNLERNSGLHFKIPFAQSVSMIDVREQSFEIQQNAYTKDTQTVENLIVKINYRLDNNTLDTTIREIGVANVHRTIVETNVYAVTRNTIGLYAADELVGHRSEITQQIHEELLRRFQGKGIELLSFTIQNIDFEDSFEAAVRRKVEAEQKALEAQNQTKESQELAKQQVIRAQAEADAIKAKADADAYAVRTMAEAEAQAMEVLNKQLAQNPNYIEYLKVTLWNGQLPVVDGGSTPIIDLRDLDIAPAATTPSSAPRTASTPAPTATPDPLEDAE